MIKIENVEVVGFEHAIRGMRNPMNSWNKSDTVMTLELRHDNNNAKTYANIGENDLALMKKLVKAGTDHRKFMRMIEVYFDIVAPQFWWSEFDTYKVGTVRNSCSKMHKIHIKSFERADFSREGIEECEKDYPGVGITLDNVIETLEWLRVKFNETQEKKFWRAIIELLPSGYNMRATVMLNYEVLANIYKEGSRRYHKLDEWNVNCEGSFCAWIKTLPYSELITGIEN